ncbi:hypothetical protein ACFLQL_04550 [Verrucomicrobiota bacterium]
MTTRRFPGLHKVTFDAVVKPSPGVSDISPFIQAGVGGFATGYLLQFGGNYNQVSALKRMGMMLREAQFAIKPGKTHAIIAEYDGLKVRLNVDGKMIVEYLEQLPLLGAGHEQVGFYVYEGIVEISNLIVYTSKAVQKKVSPDEGEGFE